MMIVRLFCPQCAFEASKQMGLSASVEVPLPIARLSESGQYQVECQKGHHSTVILDNLKFELLFEMGLNALVDGYTREAVSSFASSLERFYEFYWCVAMFHFGFSYSEVLEYWKPISKQSERQLGAYVTASLLLTKSQPELLNTNRDVPFRNKVIHNGYVPTEGEAESFGNVVMDLLNNTLDGLRKTVPETLDKTYGQVSPRGINEQIPEETKEDEESLTGCVNILTTIDVRHPPKGDDRRVGDVRAQFGRILDDRQEHGMELLDEQEFAQRFPDAPRADRDTE